MNEALNLSALLAGNPYPGRGIVIGRSADNTQAVIAYFIMGRSVNSRNRIFTQTPDGIRTQAFDPGKMVDPSLIIYHPVRVLDTQGGQATIVTNGDQTDTIRDTMSAGLGYLPALMQREFEPDAPNYTPRISGVVFPDGAYMLSILKSDDGDPTCCLRNVFTFDHPKAGVGHFIHTYQGDGTPLPSFAGEPEKVVIAGDIDAFTRQIWQSLDEQNKVSLYTRFIDLKTGRASFRIVNKNA